MKVWQISHLLLIILVENSFKHSQNLTKWFVHIVIELRQDTLYMTIDNSLADENLKKMSTQVGLNNLRQRLHFIYNNNFSLNEKQSEFTYETTLTLTLEKLIL